jgi:hypothetical protein
MGLYGVVVFLFVIDRSAPLTDPGRARRAAGALTALPGRSFLIDGLDLKLLLDGARGQYQIESHIKKTPASRAGIFLYANKTNRALGASGDGGKRPTCGYFGPATILNLYRIAHSEFDGG